MVFQTAGERNYHIFYQLVAGADENPALRDRLMLDGCEAFSYLNQSGVTRIEGQVEEVRWVDFLLTFFSCTSVLCFLFNTLTKGCITCTNVDRFLFFRGFEPF